MTLTVVLPGMILGPVMAKRVSGSLEMIYRLLKGKVPAIPNIGFAITDVEGLVDLQLRSDDKPRSGRPALSCCRRVLVDVRGGKSAARAARTESKCCHESSFARFYGEAGCRLSAGGPLYISYARTASRV